GYTSTLIDNSTNKTIDLKLVSSASAAPRFTAFTLTGGGLAFNGTNGAPGGNYYLLASTNITLPLTNWTILPTNSFHPGGNFTPPNGLPTNAQHFSLLRLP